MGHIRMGVNVLPMDQRLKNCIKMLLFYWALSTFSSSIVFVKVSCLWLSHYSYDS
jgi:hypothetical protein